MNGTSATAGAKTFTLADIEKAVKAVESLPKETDWMLASPDGKCWKGKPEDLLQVLMPHHPLLKPTTLELFKAPT